jgi:short-subunit dehydrogenase
VARLELAGDHITVTLVLPSITATEFRGGMYANGPEQATGGLTPHSPEYVGRFILRALRTGEARIDVPPGPEQAELPDAA